MSFSSQLNNFNYVNPQSKKKYTLNPLTLIDSKRSEHTQLKIVDKKIEAKRNYAQNQIEGNVTLDSIKYNFTRLRNGTDGRYLLFYTKENQLISLDLIRLSG